MLNVSRTTVSESWLAAPLPLKSHKALDTRAVITSRFSVSTTINSDLFPELLSWSAMMDTQPASPCSQKFPSDVSKREPDVETVDTVLGATLCLSLIFDPTSLDFGFDHSCLEGLDDLLVYSPTEAFEESCWTEATHSHSDRMSTAVPFPFPPSSKKSMRRRRTRSPLVTSSSSDDSDTDSDECMTFKEDAHLDILNDAVSSGMNPVGEFPSYVSNVHVVVELLLATPLVS
ncbi:hypothetical protein BDZ97DRAFT_1366668 [Flammula alnicola]|nr:hypothetical protein BDZ97DRAFT_1366668 [Flammula alnicola]